MKIDSFILKLQNEIDKRIKIASDSLLVNDTTTAKEHMDWVITATDIINKSKKKPNKLKWAIAVGLATVFLIGLGLAIRIPETNISVDVIAKSVSFHINKAWVLNNRFYPSELNVTNLEEVNAAGINIKITKKQPFDFNLKGPGIVADKLEFSTNAEITIRLQDTSQNFIIKNDTFVTDIQVKKARLNIDNGLLDTAVDFEIPEIFKIRSSPSVAIPIDIMLADTAGWSFKDIRIADINFLEESNPGSGKFISSILSGNIKVLETEEDTRLEEGDWLNLENLKSRRSQITKSGSHLIIHIEGEVSEARAGSELFEKKLNPSLLEYLYYAKSFAFFWSVIVFIFSLTWSIKNTIFTNQL